MLYDDNYLPDYWRFWIWNFSLPDPAGDFVYSLYSDSAGKVWDKRNLLFPARGRCVDNHNLCIVGAENEENCLREHETVAQEYMIAYKK